MEDYKIIKIDPDDVIIVTVSNYSFLYEMELIEPRFKKAFPDKKVLIGPGRQSGSCLPSGCWQS